MTEPSIFTLPAEEEQQRVALINKLCKLQAKVNAEVFSYGQTADCICLTTEEGEVGLRVGWPWANHGKSIDFIVTVVEQHIAKCLEASDLANQHIRGQLAELAHAAGVTPGDIARLGAGL